MSQHFRTWSAVFPILLRTCGGRRQVLLHRRQNTGYMDGMWDIAGSGHVDAGETATQALIREAMEELGVELRPEDVSFAHLSHRPGERAYYDIYFLVHSWTGTPEIREPEKCSALSWFDVDALPEDMIAIRREDLLHCLHGEAYSEKQAEPAVQPCDRTPPGAGVDRRETLADIDRDALIDLIEIYAKNFLALDGVWFQSVERSCGMDEAMHHDLEAWSRFTVTEARRIKAFLGLPAHPGIEGLDRALRLRFCANANPLRIESDSSSLTCTVTQCRVQAARARKGMSYHPCKRVGLAEYSGFAKTIDDRLECECLSCYPDAIDPDCSCKWRFTLREDEP